jgi:hypothetical protein
MAAKPGNIGKVESGIKMGFSPCHSFGIVTDVMNGLQQIL